MAAIEAQGSVERDYEIINTDRSALARVSGAIAKRYGDSGFQGAAPPRARPHNFQCSPLARTPAPTPMPPPPLTPHPPALPLGTCARARAQATCA